MMAPWTAYAQATKALFEGDPDVTVEYDDDGRKLTVRVHGQDKAESISEILPTDAQFGGIVLTIDVVPDNDAELTPADHLRRAFAGNPHFVDVLEVPVSPMTFGATYALFMPECLQFYVDDLQSPYGARTATVEQVAREVLSLPDGVFVSSAEL